MNLRPDHIPTLSRLSEHDLQLLEIRRLAGEDVSLSFRIPVPSLPTVGGGK